jgi:Glycosyl hydrolase family 71
MALAQTAHIDGFALNIRADDTLTATSLPIAFSAAESLGFKLILSLDYAGGGPFTADAAKKLINKYSVSSAYFKEDGRPLVSTFEGPLSAGDWSSIKAATNCVFMPDWSSLGAKLALDAAPGVLDGLFSWAPWPWGNTNSNTYVDASYLEFLKTAKDKYGREERYSMSLPLPLLCIQYMLPVLNC